MKKLLLIVVLFCFALMNTSSNHCSAQTMVEIPDTNFRNFIDITYIGFIIGDSLLIDSAATLTGSLNCNGNAFAVLSGVEPFVNITILNCSDNQLAVLPSLSTLSKLTGMHVGENLLTSIPSLATTDSLEIFYSQFNQITVLPDLSNNPKIKWLFCQENELTTKH